MLGAKSLERGNRYRYLPFGMVFLTAALWHLTLKISTGDDVVYFQTLMDGRSIWEILAHRYQTWSSRMAIEFVLIPLVHHPVLWKILDVGVVTAIPALLYQILRREGDTEEIKSRMRWMACGFTLLYPFSDMASAGWIATTANYLWPLFGLLFIAWLVKKRIGGQKIAWHEAVFGIVCCVYSSSQEQVAVILLAILLTAIFSAVRRSGLRQPFFYLLTGIDIVSLITILRCPGNAIRSAQEVEGRMPQFRDFSFWEKIYLGASNVERIFIAQVNSIFLIFTVLLAVYVSKKTRDYWKTLGAGVPLLVLLGYSVIRTGHPWYEKIFIVPKQAAGWNFGELETWLPILFFVVTAAGILSGMYFLFKDTIEIYVYLALLLGVGLASGVVMGFSPTIYASADRPYLYLYFILIFTSLLLVKRGEKEHPLERGSLPHKLCCTVGILFVLVNVAEVFWMCHIM